MNVIRSSWSRHRQGRNFSPEVSGDQPHRGNWRHDLNRALPATWLTARSSWKARKCDELVRFNGL